MRYRVIIWNNNGDRSEWHADTMKHALDLAKDHRTPCNRTVKIGEGGDAIRHWTRTEGRTGNQWASRATAECSR